MLVHRDNGDQSGDDMKGGKSRLVAIGPGGAPETSVEPLANISEPPEDVACRDGGKGHLIGDALKSVYRRTLEEDIPDDFLDLLKQLK